MNGTIYVKNIKLVSNEQLSIEYREGESTVRIKTTDASNKTTLIGLFGLEIIEVRNTLDDAIKAMTKENT